MKIEISTDFEDVRKSVKRWGSAGQRAAVWAVNDTANVVRDDLRTEMRRVFDRPTSFTLNSVRVKYANSTRPEAFVWLKDEAGKGTPADVYLGPQIFGGDRQLKRMEKALLANGLMPSGCFCVPAGGAKLDQYGNVSRGQVVQILSQLKAQRGGGFESRASNSAASRRARAKQGVTYFVLTKPWGKLKPGIYLRKKLVRSSKVTPVFLYVKSVKYKPRFDFFGVADRSAAKNLPRIFNEKLVRSIEKEIN